MNNSLSMDNNLFRTLFDSASIGKAVLTLTGEIVEANPSLCSTLGYSRQELLGTSFRHLLNLEDGGKSLQRCLHKSGYTLWLNLTQTVVRDEEGTPSYIFMEIQEVLGDKGIAEFGQFRSLFEHDSDMILLVAVDGRLIDMNASAEKGLGYTTDELRDTQVTPATLLQAGDVVDVVGRFTSATQGNCEEFDASVVHRAGHLLPLSVRLVPMRREADVLGVFVIARPLTPRNLGKERSDIEAIFRLISNTSQDFLTSCYPDGQICYVSPNVANILGYSHGELLYRNISSIYHPEDWNKVQALLATPSNHHVLEVRLLHKSGRYIWFEKTIHIVRDAQGHAVKRTSVWRVATKRIEAETALRKQEEMYRMLVEESPNAIAVSVNGRWQYVNHSLVELFGGKSKDEILGISALDLLHPKYVELVKERILDVEKGEVARPVEIIFQRLDGKPFHAETISIPTIYEGMPAAHTIISNITQKKEEQSAFLAAEKLKVAGQLAAGIAHEIRNPLTAIKGFVKLMRTRVKEEYLDIISEEITRVEGIVTELLLLAKPGAMKIARTDLMLALRNVVSLLESEAHLYNIEMVQQYDVERYCVECDADQMKQVFINFLRNAMEAMPDGGRITVRSARTDQHFKIRISDQGQGIPADLLARIGEPFFTTKEKGTGLGLMISKKIIEDNGGEFRITSTVGEGTAVEIRFPVGI